MKKFLLLLILLSGIMQQANAYTSYAPTIMMMGAVANSHRRCRQYKSKLQYCLEGKGGEACYMKYDSCTKHGGGNACKQRRK